MLAEISDNVAAIKSKLEEDSGPKILNQKKEPVDVHVVYPGGAVIKSTERRRLENEAKLFWNIYFKDTKKDKSKPDDSRSKTQARKEALKEINKEREAGGKKKVTMKDVESQKGRGMNKVNERFQREWKSKQKELNASIDKVKKADKKGVTDKVADKVKKSGLDINKNKVAAEASIFWHVYYKIKSRKEKAKDTKGKTKITPVKGAIEKVKEVKKPKKEGKGFLGWLMGLFAPFAKVLAPLLMGAGGGLLAVLGGAFGTLMAAIGPLIVAGAGIFALVAAVAFAAVQIGKAWKGWKDMKQAQKEAEHAEKHGKEQGLIVQDIYKERMEKAKAAGLHDEARIAELQGQMMARGDEYTRRMHQHEGMFKRTEHRKRKEQEKMDAEGWDEKSEAISTELRALLDKQLQREAKGEKVRRMADEVTFDKFYVNMHKQYGVGVHSEDVQKRAHAVAERKAMGKEEVITKLDHPEKWAAMEKEKEEKERKAMKEGTGKYKKITRVRDFISRPGMLPVSFDSKDDILGFKQGGPVSSLLKQVTSDVNILTGPDKFGKFQLDAIGLSNAYLKQLVELTVKLLQKGSSGGGGGRGVIPPSPLPPDNSIQGNMGGPTYTDSRSDFYGSAYSMHTPSVPA